MKTKQDPNPNKNNMLQKHISLVVVTALLLVTAASASLIGGSTSRAHSDAPPAGTYEILHSFTGNAGYGFNGDTNGANPYGPLIQGPDGNFYGTTTNGSATATAPWGTVFKMDVTGKITILHHFVLAAGGDGVNPLSGLTLAKDGNFYGTTYTASGAQGGGAFGGVVFRISPAGAYQKLFTFSGFEGGFPKAGVIQAKDGNLYGTATKGGSDGRYNYGGTVYKVALGGRPIMLHGFAAKDGVAPTCDLLQGSDGALYGTTYAAGTGGFGTVFRVTTNGSFSVLHTFTGADGANPVGGLTQTADGALYGTAATGGKYNLGTVFKIDSSGAFSVIHTFIVTEGGKPLGNLLLANDGNFYGTANNAGRNYGTVFKLTPAGSLTVLHTFGEIKGDGGLPVAGLIQANDGRLYGTTQFGGTQNKGTVFRLDLGLKPLVALTTR